MTAAKVSRHAGRQAGHHRMNGSLPMSARKARVVAGGFSMNGDSHV